MSASEEKTQVMLDRDQRAALRRELEFAATGWGSIPFTREDIHGAAEHLRLIAEAMDALGWSEHSEAPEVQPFPVTAAVAAWAREQAQDLGRALGAPMGIEPCDQELEDFAVLAAIGGGA